MRELSLHKSYLPANSLKSAAGPRACRSLLLLLSGHYHGASENGLCRVTPCLKTRLKGESLTLHVTTDIDAIMENEGEQSQVSIVCKLSDGDIFEMVRRTILRFGAS